MRVASKASKDLAEAFRELKLLREKVAKAEAEAVARRRSADHVVDNDRRGGEDDGAP